LSGADLRGMKFGRANLRRADFSGANLEGVHLFNCEIPLANFRGARLSRGSLALSRCQSADFTNAELRHVDLSSANLAVAKLNGADLTGSILHHTHFDQTSVAGACFNDVWIQQTKFLNLDLSEARDLDKIHNHAFSSVDIGTIYNSRGKIPDEFLRRCGFSKKLIAAVRSIFENPIEFFSCFISYTEADDALSKKLYNDLQGEGVRCWRWREDAKWGSTLAKEIDENIRAYDKLIVVLSEQSLASEPVIREIERALQKEAREGKEVLFPIRVDDAVFRWEHALQADLVRKVIGDFSRWREPTAYSAAVKNLLDGLSATARREV